MAARRSGEGLAGTEGVGGGQAPAQKAARAGLGADAAQQAKVALDEARTAAAKGDHQACRAAATRTEQQLGRMP